MQGVEVEVQGGVGSRSDGLSVRDCVVFGFIKCSKGVC